jgi:hypothetical protein
MRAVCCLLISLIIFCSCKKSNGVNPTPVPGGGTVYVSGFSYDSIKRVFESVYWQDTVAHMLPGSDASGSYTWAITYSGNELFVAGQSSEKIMGAGYWISGSLHNPNQDTATLTEVRGICVSSHNIYLAGDGINSPADSGVNTYAKIWHDGVTTNLNNSPGLSVAVGVTVAADLNTYVAWNKGRPNGLHIAMYNKNENSFVLDSSYIDNTCRAICSSGSDVYIAGNLHNGNAYLPVYWKNGAMVKISINGESQISSFYATGIAVSGNDVYISGFENMGLMSYAIYWKNGVKHRVSDGSLYSGGWAIAVSGSDVYVAGTANYLPVYWKNDVLHNLSYAPANTGYETTGIVIAPPVN